ncbi:MAG: glycoside hydrolase family 3 protein [Gemmatimonadota bacterium]|nr:glycoside hydrolase family 3 protein [Gemmatimonadota bacterium]
MTSFTSSHTAVARRASDVEERVAELLARMNLDQKIGQMTQPERMNVTPDEVKRYHIGSVLSGGGSCPGDNRPADWVAMNDAYWAASMEEDEGHLAIPILYGVDAIHGNANVLGATVFPHNIGLGAAGDPELIERIGRVTAREVLATGVDWTFAPTLAVARDVRWGRTYESYSEDPGVVSRYAGRIVRGLQGGGGSGGVEGGSEGRLDAEIGHGAGLPALGPEGVVACAKHWVGDGGTRDGVDQGNAVMDEEELRRVHIAPYVSALEAGALTVMVSLSSWNGEKCHAHRYLIQDVLKGEMGFRGFVVSDWNGVDPLAEDYGEAVAMAVNAGIDMVMVPETWKAFIAALRERVERGDVPVERIDDAVGRILRVKFACGLFERGRPWGRRGANGSSFGSQAHREVAREAVRKSLVLLKNEGGVLPLDKGGRILVTGRGADDRGRLCGGFTVEWQGVVGNDRIEGGTSVWEGIKAVVPGAVLGGVGGVGEGQSVGGPQDMGEEEGDFDAAVVVIGERPYAEGLGDIREAGPVRPGTNQLPAGPGVLEPYGDTLQLAVLHPGDLRTIRVLRERGIPVVVVLVSGRPLVVDDELAASAAFVAAWLPGSEGGGVADVLFGDYDFEGRLPMGWPGGWGRVLFPRGFGLHLLGSEV